MGGPGSGGHNRKSAESHLIAGTYRPDRGHGKVAGTIGPPEPVPAMPRGLSRPARATWRRLMAAYEGWSTHEALLLELALRARDRAEECRQQIAEEGIVLAGKRGATRAHPLVKVQRAEERFVADVFRQLRLGR